MSQTQSKESSQVPDLSTDKTAPKEEVEEEEKPPYYKRITDDDLYRNSSQYRMWSYTADHLREKRSETCQRATEVVNRKLEEFVNTHQDELTEEDMKILKLKASPLTMDEELKLINFYSKKVQVIAQHLNLPTEVVATSITFFRRFYLENSVSEYDPKNLVHTTIFLACKSENYFISVDSFAKKAKSSRDAILKYEFKLLESLKFSLLNHHPYKPLHGFFLDIQTVLHGKVDLKYMGQIYDRCKKRITDALLTDVVYLYTPPQITLAILLMEDEQLVKRYLGMKFGKEETPEEGDIDSKKKDDSAPDTEDTESKDKESTKKAPEDINFDKLFSVIEECKQTLKNSESVSTEEAKRVAAKNYYCQKPDILLQKLKRKKEATDLEDGEPTSKKQKLDE